MGDFASEMLAHLPRLRRYARSLLHHPADADDLVQMTMVRALEKAHLFEPGTNLCGWLVTIMHNEHVNTVRRGIRSPFMVSDEAIQHIGCPETQEAPIELYEIRRAIGRLHPDQRKALLLHWLHGFKYEEIAATLNLPLGTVQSRISRARKALQALLANSRSRVGIAHPASSREGAEILTA
ncbi:MAG: RNA polymerase sigma factor [Alphaproteobacteria bacterium]|nr:RNA polymerase sigma factor [Alphaproteobacteria bacterium]